MLGSSLRQDGAVPHAGVAPVDEEISRIEVPNPPLAEAAAVLAAP